ncbi:nucleolar protein 14-like [Ylistrum balloti]|uniref:nucleolar protein 14-like n=1 Tax=Ylistrum balloti TaxID=509963 RepID=UPI002905B69E|nr:nucleolar protein 14-like [Ylistrum balloti]
MGKKKKNISDIVRSKQKPSAKKINPFEVKINRVKHDVLGRKVSKHDKGMPGLSRSKAMKKREQTLLHEYDQRMKSNTFVDKRFGENDTNMNIEDKMMKRFAMERSHDKTNKYSLNDEDDDLTHYGQSLSEIEKFEDPVVSDDEDDDDRGKISGKMVSEEHFGGFLFETQDNPTDQSNKSWKEKMEETIAKSKKEKHDRQMEKEKTLQMTEKLDSEFQDLMKLMSKSKKSKDDLKEKPKVDDYDIAVRELKFESKGEATDRLKTEEELAKEEKERLDKLEEDRLRRMRGDGDDEEPKIVHFSADDLSDGYALDTSIKERFHISYKDGKLLMPGNDDDDGSNSGGDEDGSRSGGDEDGSRSGENEDDSDVEGEGDTDGEDEEDDKEEEDSAEDDDDDSDDDSYKDIQSDEEEEKNTEEPEDKPVKKPAPKVDLKKKKKIMDAARKEVPYVFEIPTEYDDLVALLQDRREADQLIIIDRICKCHHPSLAEGNKQKLEVFLGTLIQYYTDLALQDPPQLDLIDKLTIPIYKLVQMSPVPSANFVLDQIKDRQEEFRQICMRKAGRGLYPALDTLLLLKLVPVLFPSSDFRHSVTTPAIIFITQMLAQCPVNHERDIAAGLFLCNLCLEFVSLSKRFVPEVVNFLHGLLFLIILKDDNKYESVIPPFKPIGNSVNLLQLDAKHNSFEFSPMKMSEVLNTEMELDALRNDSFRLQATHSCVTLIGEFSSLYKDLPTFREVFSPILYMFGKIDKNQYPVTLKEMMAMVVEEISHHSNILRKPLVMNKKKPQPMRTFEPLVEEVFEERKIKQKSSSKQLNEKQKLLHKYKKEMKGAMREIRKDNQFLARKQLKDQIERDEERQGKVRKLHQMLATQEGEYKAMKRAKPSPSPS